MQLPVEEDLAAIIIAAVAEGVTAATVVTATTTVVAATVAVTGIAAAAEQDDYQNDYPKAIVGTVTKHINSLSSRNVFLDGCLARKDSGFIQRLCFHRTAFLTVHVIICRGQFGCHRH